MDRVSDMVDGFKKWVPVKFARGRFSPLLRLKIGESLIVPHKEFKPLYNTVYQLKRRHPGTDFEYLECVNGYVVKRTA